MPYDDQTLTMSDVAKASNPGHLRANRLKYCLAFPKWSTFCFGGLAFFTVLTFLVHYMFVVGTLLFLCLCAFYWVHLRERFIHGCINPGVIVSEEQGLIAVATDLTTGIGSYPVIKVLHHPLLMMLNQRRSKGTLVPTVAVYRGDENSPHWSDFFPIAVDCVTFGREPVDRILRQIDPEDWDQLRGGLEQVPRPFRPGLYFVDPT